MSTAPSVRLLVGLLAASAAALTACSSATPGDGSLAEHLERTVTVTSAPPSTAPTQLVSRSAAASTRVAAIPPELLPALLAVRDVGAGYRTTTPAPASRLPCTPGQPPADQQLDATEHGGIDFVDASGRVLVTESIFVYGSVTDAIRHQQIDEQGLHCRSGSVNGTAMDVAGPYPLGGQLHTSRRPDRSESWSIANSAINGELVLVRIHAVVVQFSFQVKAGVQPRLDAERVIERGIDKLVAAAS